MKVGLVLALVACGGSSPSNQVLEGECQIVGDAPDYLESFTCFEDFQTLGSLPIDATLPSATSVKVVMDQVDGDHLYFQNTQEFEIHYRFVSTHLSGNGLPVVPDLGTFNSTEYFSPERRFVLGAATYYALPDRWVVELSPYDTASVEMIERLFAKVKQQAYFGPELAFHPTSEAQEALALPADIPVVTTDELYAGIDYQPLSLGTAVGTLHFTTVANLANREYYSPYTILVLDSAPNDLSVVQGTITEAFQTPLSHINVLAHTRHSPNMGLREARTNPELLALEGQLVKLTTTAQDWTVEPISAEDAQAYWDTHAPPAVTLPAIDLSVAEITDIADATPDPVGAETLLGNLKKAIPTYGGKASHYSVLVKTPGVPIRKAFVVPMFFYDQFMKDNGFYARIDALLADPMFTTDTATRDAALEQLRADIIAAPFDAAFSAALDAKVHSDVAWSAATKLKFRSSSNSEDLEGFPCAGCYDSFAGKTADIADMLKAIKRVYASAWELRTFDLRSFYRVDHTSLGISILCHEFFDDEDANGVAITGNPFDASGLDPAFYVNVQKGGDVEVVAPPAGVTSDQFLYYFTQPNQPISYIAHSSLILPGTTVLTPAQAFELGQALSLIQERLSPAYGPGAGNTGWYALEVDFKFTDEGLVVKQARWYPDPFGGE